MIKLLEHHPRESAGEYAFRTLHFNIINLILKPGQPLRETDLAEELGLSRTPLREAIMRLSRIHLVEVVPQRGTRVALIDAALIDEARRMRCILETAMAQEACDRATEDDLYSLEQNIHMQKFYLEQENHPRLLELDNDFHRTLFDICNAGRTYQVMDNLRGQYDIVRHISLHHLSAFKAVAEHELIFLALQSRNKAVIGQEVSSHISRYASEAEESQMRKEFPQYFVSQRI